MEYKIIDGRCYRVTDHGQSETTLTEVLHAVKDKETVKLMIKQGVEEAIHDMAARLYSNFIVMKHDSEFDQEIVELSEYYIDSLVAAVLNKEPFERPVHPEKARTNNVEAIQELMNIVKAAKEVKLDTLEKDKDYILTVTFENFSSAEVNMKSIQTVCKNFKELHTNLSFVIQVNSQGITYNISEVK